MLSIVSCSGKNLSFFSMPFADDNTMLSFVKAFHIWVYVCLCICSGVEVVHMCTHVEAKGQPQVSFLTCCPCFFEIEFLYDLDLSK